ncbi:hypothetical protein [Sediminicoccus sp. BL-A-41-H5]|uniref:hypothetical protein n=1 Tax=Sediminicoccus sp. BL-A-41-H5 TaxID=3421106 RepID=UPI003D66D245
MHPLPALLPRGVAETGLRLPRRRALSADQGQRIDHRRADPDRGLPAKTRIIRLIGHSVSAPPAAAPQRALPGTTEARREAA